MKNKLCKNCGKTKEEHFEEPTTGIKDICSFTGKFEPITNHSPKEKKEVSSGHSTPEKIPASVSEDNHSPTEQGDSIDKSVSAPEDFRLEDKTYNLIMITGNEEHDYFVCDEEDIKKALKLLKKDLQKELHYDDLTIKRILLKRFGGLADEK